MKRRGFIKLCSTAAVTAALSPSMLGTALAAEPVLYKRAKLMDRQGKPIKASQLAVGEEYVFHYPYNSTPVLLLHLDKPANGGVGRDGGLVAFCAVCTHQMQYPRKGDANLFNYYHNEKSGAAERSGVIVCCAHNSVFDPAQGAKVLGGQATHPLTAIALEYDAATDEVYAVGTRGQEIYEDFFKAYKQVLNEDYGRGQYKTLIEGQAPVSLLKEFVSMQVRC